MKACHIITVCLLMALPTAAQVRLGVKGGLQLTQMEFSDEALRSSNRAGYFIGPAIKVALPVTGISIDVAALYDRRDLKADDRTFHQQSLLLPANVRFSAGIGETLAIFLAAGPQFSFNVGDDVIQWVKGNGETRQFSLQETMLSVNLGAGITIANHLEAHIFYNIPVSKTADFTWDELGSQLEQQTWNHAKSRTNAWRVALTYYF